MTPDDAADLSTAARFLYIGTTGDVVLDTIGGDTLTFVDVGGFLPVRTRRVRATGTTATGIVALW